METVDAITGADQDLVYEHLIDVGPLCASQISADLFISLSRVGQALELLEAAGRVHRRPDRDEHMVAEEAEIPWGVARPFGRRRSS